MIARNLPEREGVYYALVNGDPKPVALTVWLAGDCLAVDLSQWCDFDLGQDHPDLDLCTRPLADPRVEWLSRIPSPAVCEAFQDWRDARAKARPPGDRWTDADKLGYADDCDKAESALIDLLEALEAEGAE